MVRFARAEGSKGSNKRVLEEPTPWSEMVRQMKKTQNGDSQIKTTNGKRKLDDKEKENKPEVKKKIKTENINSKNKCEGEISGAKNVVGLKSKKKMKKGTAKKKSMENNETKGNEVHNNNSEGEHETGGNVSKKTMKKKVIGKKKIKKVTAVVQKEIRKGGANEPKKKKVLEGKKMKNAGLKKTANVSNIEVRNEEVNTVCDNNEVEMPAVKNATQMTEEEKGNPGIKLELKENDQMTCFDGVWVSREAVPRLEELKKSLQGNNDKGLAFKALKNAEEKEHGFLARHLLNEKKKELNPLVQACKDTRLQKVMKKKTTVVQKKKKKVGANDPKKEEVVKCQKKKKAGLKKSANVNNTEVRNEEVNTICDNDDDENATQMTGEIMKGPRIKVEYEENDQMTFFDGIWVWKESVPKLEKLKKNLAMLEDKDKYFQACNALKNARKRINRSLRKHLLKIKELYPEVQDCSSSKLQNVTTPKIGDQELSWFECCWVTKDGAKRLMNLKAELIRNGVSSIELREVMRRERRAEEKFVKDRRKLRCLRCRQFGHLLKECPELDVGFGEDQNICYSCGSAEHFSSKCPQKKEGNSFPHAKCFICNKLGHISRHCQDNPRGLYPNGGSCRGCGSVEHLAANCPTLQAEKEEETIRLDRIDGNAVESLDVKPPVSSKWVSNKSPGKKKVKVVKF